MKDTHKNDRGLRSAIGRVRGLGSARDGTLHWIGMKVTAIALVPLGVWFIISALSLASADHATAIIWFKDPMHALVMVLFLGFGLHHSAHGLQVVIEDYIAGHGVKTVLLIVNVLAHLALAAAAALALISVLLKG